MSSGSIGQVEFTGLLNTSSGQSLPEVASLDSRRQARDRAAILERSGFDRVLIDDRSGRGEARALAAFVLAGSTALGVSIPHRLGEADPVTAARELAELDQVGDGRLSLRLVSANEKAGAPFCHETQMSRVDEYLVLLKRLWSNGAAFDHEGAFYSLIQAFSPIKPFGEGITLALGGSSGTAVKIAARHADRFVLPQGKPAEVALTVERVRAAAQSYGRAGKIRFSLDVGLGGEAVTLPALLAYRDAGVAEFVVHGLETETDIASFGQGVIAPIRRAEFVAETFARRAPGRVPFSAGREV